MHYSTTKENRWEGGATNLWKRGKGTCLSRERCDEWLNAKGDGLTGEDLFKLNIITEILYYEIPQGSIIGPLLFSVFTNHFFMILLLGVLHVHCNVFEQVAVKLAFTIQKVIKCSEQICRAIGSTTRGHCSVPEQGTTFLQSTFPNR